MTGHLRVLPDARQPLVETVPLFPAPAPEALSLSARYAVKAYRATKEAKDRPIYRPSSSKAACDECAAVQHEQRGKAPLRRPVRFLRTFPDGGPDLLLCAGHRHLWAELDSSDGAAP